MDERGGKGERKRGLRVRGRRMKGEIEKRENDETGKGSEAIEGSN